MHYIYQPLETAHAARCTVIKLLLNLNEVCACYYDRIFSQYCPDWQIFHLLCKAC